MNQPLRKVPTTPSEPLSKIVTKTGSESIDSTATYQESEPGC